MAKGNNENNEERIIKLLKNLETAILSTLRTRITNMNFFTCEDGSYINLNYVTKFKVEESTPEKFEAVAYLSNSQRVILITCSSYDEADECIDSILQSTNSYIEMEDNEDEEEEE